MIGIVGQGFVGNAVYQKFKNYFDVLTYDIEEEDKIVSGERAEKIEKDDGVRDVKKLV